MNFDSFSPAPAEVRAAVPNASFFLAPADLGELARLLDLASEERAKVLVWGGGTHQGYGGRVAADVVVSTSRLSRIIAWEPDDLTLVCEAGVTCAEVEERLATKSQTAALVEGLAQATVGGVVASGVSGYRRARYGPIRDRMLEVTLVTGDGRVVRGGGRVVKNVSGFDLPRLATGSFGSLGVIGAVCLKLWPMQDTSLTVECPDAVAAWRALYRPLAVLETDRGSFAFLQGAKADVENQAQRIGGEVRSGMEWPPSPVGDVVISIRVPPASIREAVRRLPQGWGFVAQHGVGEVMSAGGSADLGWLVETRDWAESLGGALVVVEGSESLYGEIDPWGMPPASLDLQRRLVAAFDPARVLNPGRLPGGL